VKYTTNTHPIISTLLGIPALLVLALVLAACTNAEAPAPDVGDMTLNLSTRTAETDLGTLQAERVEHSYVGPLNDGQAIGIAFLDDVGGGVRQDAGQSVVVYLYQRQNLAVLIGDLDADGTATLTSGDLSDFDATVDLRMEGDAVTGTATFLDEQAISFTAPAASGGAGVYWARGTDANPDVSADWVVLPDERQWGCICAPPGFSPCCQMQR
jgi:hypothetical protein